MICDWCSLHIGHEARQRNPAWTLRPCSVYRLASIKRHEKGAMHKNAAATQAQVAAIVAHGGIRGALNRPTSVNKMALLGALRCIYWLVKEELPFSTKYVPLLKLMKSLGCDYIDHLNVGGNATYSSEMTKQEFVELLAGEVIEMSLEAIRQSPAFGLLVDESTDVSTTKQLIMYIRYMKTNGETKTSFLALAKIKDGRADTIVNEVKAILQNFDLPIAKLTGFSSDGASVMVGREGGVAAKLRRDAPHMMSIHCVAHRLALGVSQAADQIEKVRRYNRMLQQLYSFYSTGPVRMAGLRELQKILEDPVIKLKEPKNVRWLSHFAAVTAVRRSVNSLIASLEREATERDDVSASGLAREVKSFDFLACTAMLCDVLAITVHLSKLFQKSDIDFTSIDSHVAATKYNLERIRGGRGREMSGLRDLMGSIPGADAYTVEKHERFTENVHDKLIDKIIGNLEARFPDSELLRAFEVFGDTDADFDIREGSSCQIICQHFGLEAETVAGEWAHVRELLFKEDEEKTLKMALKRLAIQFSDVAPYLAQIATAVLVLPVSTVDCERGFSAMNRLKTPLRNRLEKLLQPVMWIVTEGPAYDKVPAAFFEKVATEWAVSRNRRLVF